jgi:hypothetical protein
MPGSEPKIITIDQINGNFHGGFPFVANWNFNDGSTPSTLTVSVVNSQGNYNISDTDIGYTTTTSVSLGSFNFNGYLVGYDIEESAQQCILTLEYIDQSVKLEMWSVGLDCRHGNKKSTDNPSRIILVGKEYNPCDKNLDSTLNFSVADSSPSDPCDPCPNFPAKGYEKTCEPEHKDLKIFPVYYTFNDLLDKVHLCGLTVVKPSDIKDSFTNHRAQHVGSLKSVLSTWCSELGLSYYYDPIKQELRFLDRSTPLTIPDKGTLETAGNVISLKYGATKSKTFSRGFIGYLGTQGEIKKYTCEREDSATLFPLTVADLLAEDSSSSNNKPTGTFDVQDGRGYDSQYPTYSPPESNSSNNAPRQVDPITSTYYSTALAYYPPPVRLAFIWFYILQILDDTDAQDWIIPPKQPQPNGSPSQSSGSNNGTIFELGNMNIRKIYSYTQNKSIFEELKGILPQEYIDYVTNEDKNNKRNTDTLGPSYYFILAQCSISLLNKQEERDVSRAKRFLGRYYYRSFDKLAVAGGDNSNSQLNIDAAGASCSYHPRGEYIQQLPIFSFGHDSSSRVGTIVTNLASDESQNITDIATPTDSTDPKKKYRSLKSFLLLDRGDAAKFSPDESEFDNWTDTWKWYENCAPKIIGNDGRPEIITNLDGDAASDSTLKLFLVRSLPSFDVAANQGKNNPWESTVKKTRTRSYENVQNGESDNGSMDHPAGNDTDASYGLMSPRTTEIVMPAGLTIYPPAQSMPFSQDQLGFRVFIQSSSKYKKIIPKFQKTVFKDVENADNVSKVDYIYKELSSEDMHVIGEQTRCMPTEQTVKTYVDKFARYMSVSNKNVSHTANLKLLGVMPKRYTVEQGLCSVQITVGDNGVYTDYTFEDKVIIPPADDVIAEQVIRQNRIAPIMGSSLQKLTKQEFTDVQTAVNNVASFNTSSLKLS